MILALLILRSDRIGPFLENIHISVLGSILQNRPLSSALPIWFGRRPTSSTILLKRKRNCYMVNSSWKLCWRIFGFTKHQYIEAPTKTWLKFVLCTMSGPRRIQQLSSSILLSLYRHPPKRLDRATYFSTNLLF